MYIMVLEHKLIILSYRLNCCINLFFIIKHYYFMKYSFINFCKNEKCFSNLTIVDRGSSQSRFSFHDYLSLSLFSLEVVILHQLIYRYLINLQLQMLHFHFSYFQIEPKCSTYFPALKQVAICLLQKQVSSHLFQKICFVHQGCYFSSVRVFAAMIYSQFLSSCRTMPVGGDFDIELDSSN